MKRKQPWTLDEKIMVGVPALFIAGFGLFSWQGSRATVIEVPSVISHSDPDDGINDINQIEFSPDSQRLAVVHQGVDGGEATVFDAQSRERLTDLQTPPMLPGWRGGAPVIQDVCWTLDGAYLAGIYNDGAVGPTKIKTNYKPYSRFNIQHKIATWSASSGHLIWTRRYANTSADSYAHLQVSRDGATLIGQGTPAVLFDAATGTPQTPANDSAPSGNYNFDASLIAVTRQAEKRLEVREVKTKRVLWRLQGQRSHAQWAQNNVLGALDYPVKNDVRLRLWDGQMRRALPAPASRNVGEFTLHPRRSLVAYCEVEYEKTKSREVKSSVLRVWDSASRREIWNYPMSGALKLDWSPDGNWLCAIEWSGAFPGATLWIFDAQGAVKSRFSRGAVNFVKWAPNSKTLAIAELNQIEIVTVES